MSLHTELPIYKRGRELLALAFEVQRQMPRDFKRSLGEKIHSQCIEMLHAMAMANASQKAERVAHVEDLLKLQHVTTILLRVGMDQRLVSTKLWSKATPLLESIGKQGGGWLKHARKASAA